MLEVLIYIAILIAGIPAGLVLFKMCSDEIKAWKKRLFIISIVCLVLGFLVWLIPGFDYKIPSDITLGFVIIMNMTIILRKY